MCIYMKTKKNNKSKSKKNKSYYKLVKENEANDKHVRSILKEN